MIYKLDENELGSKENGKSMFTEPGSLWESVLHLSFPSRIQKSIMFTVFGKKKGNIFFPIYNFRF